MRAVRIGGGGRDSGGPDRSPARAVPGKSVLCRASCCVRAGRRTQRGGVREPSHPISICGICKRMRRRDDRKSQSRFLQGLGIARGGGRLAGLKDSSLVTYDSRPGLTRWGKQRPVIGDVRNIRPSATLFHMAVHKPLASWGLVRHSRPAIQRSLVLIVPRAADLKEVRDTLLGVLTRRSVSWMTWPRWVGSSRGARRRGFPRGCVLQASE